MDAANSHQKANPAYICCMNPATLRNGLIFALCFYGTLGVIAGLIWG